MKRNVKAFLCAFAAAFSVCCLSCSDGGGDDDNEDVTIPADFTPDKTIEFSVTENSTNAEKTMLILKYERSAVGAKEQVEIKGKICIKVNGEVTVSYDSVTFELDEYGAVFDSNKKGSDGKITDMEFAKEYKANLSVKKQVKAGDTVTVLFKKDEITGEGKDAEAIQGLMAALIDTDEAVGHYNALVEETNNYQPVFSKNEDNSGNTGNDDGSNLPEGAVKLQLYKKTADDTTDDDKADSVAIGNWTKPFAFIQVGDLEKVEVGTKIYFTVADCEGKSFQIDNWDWISYSDKIYNAKNDTAINGTEGTEENAGKYKFSVVPGTYYFTITDENKDNLSCAIEIHGDKGVVFSNFAYLNPEK